MIHCSNLQQLVSTMYNYRDSITRGGYSYQHVQFLQLVTFTFAISTTSQFYILLANHALLQSVPTYCIDSLT